MSGVWPRIKNAAVWGRPHRSYVDRSTTPLQRQPFVRPSVRSSMWVAYILTRLPCRRAPILEPTVPETYQNVIWLWNRGHNWHRAAPQHQNLMRRATAAAAVQSPNCTSVRFHLAASPFSVCRLLPLSVCLSVSLSLSLLALASLARSARRQPCLASLVNTTRIYSSCPAFSCQL